MHIIIFTSLKATERPRKVHVRHIGTTYGSLLPIDQKDSNFTQKNQPHITKTSNQTDPEHSLSPDSVINTWELMDGLDEEQEQEQEIANAKKLPYASILDKPSSCRYTAFDGSARKKLLDSFESLSRVYN